MTRICTAGGQGMWISRMLSTLGIDVGLYGPFGGKVGAVLRTLVERDGIRVVASAAAHNGSYIHDRRGN
jgi:1-phosphofructokinase